jgi:hypothetical protein
VLLVCEEERDGRAGQFETRRWTGVWMVSFLGARPVEADGLAGESDKVVEQVAVVADG